MYRVVLTIVGCSTLIAQSNNNRITNTSDSTLAAAVTLGSLLPANSSNISAGQVQFQIRNRNDASGYRLDASATFTTTTTASVSGGSTIAASDIGIGIISVVAQSNVIVPRVDAILPGFNYDPTGATVANGLTPYRGASLGQATIADLLTSKKILSGPKIASTINFPQPNALTVTVKTGVLPQYFTPCNFTAIITLTLSDGP